MDVTQSSSGGASGSSASQSSAAPRESALSSDFETFLKMLTTQMENQDPLNPIESADFAVQLATFSGVEQQVKTNDLLSGLSAGLTGDVLSQFAGWVGLSGKSTAPVFFDGNPIELELNPKPNSDRAVLEARDQSGRLVEARTVPATASLFEWTGQSVEGQTFLEGRYTFTLKSYSGEDMIGEADVEVFQRVAEARLSDGEVEVVFEGGGTAPASDVSALREN